MKGIFGILMVIAVLCLPGQISGETSSGVLSIAGKLESITPFAAAVSYSVALPMAEDDVVYSLRIASSDNPADSLLGKNYIIDWQLPAGTGTAEGFTAYFDGHHYRYSDHRLRENHFQWDSIPFVTSSGGIQRNGLFVDLLPFSIAAHLREILADPTFTVTLSSGISDGRNADIIRATRHVNGIESQQLELSVDRSTGLPLKSSTLYNPGLIGEQEINAVYSYTPVPEIEAAESEDSLIARYPEIFGKYRVSNYTIENLRGLPLPGFALPTTTRERYLYHKGEGFACPTIIAVLDPEVASTEAVISTLRGTTDRIPRQTGLLLMFISNDIDRIETQTGGIRPGEALLTSAMPFVRACGINAYPTIIICDASGGVSDIILGSSSSLADEIIQKISLLK